MTRTNTYPTKDFYSAVILRTLNHPIQDIEKHRSGSSIFVFADPNRTAENELISFWNKELLVEPRKLIDAINELKTRIYS